MNNLYKNSLGVVIYSDISVLSETICQCFRMRVPVGLIQLLYQISYENSIINVIYIFNLLCECLQHYTVDIT